jgi:hypothetical protein
MQVIKTEVAPKTSTNGTPLLRVTFRGEGGECVVVDMADCGSLSTNFGAAVERAKAVLVQTAAFDVAANEYEAQSNGNFEQLAVPMAKG